MRCAHPERPPNFSIASPSFSFDTFSSRMKLRLPWLCALALLIALGALFWLNRKQAAELTKLQEENQEYQKVRLTLEENSKTQDQAKDAELVSLRQDKEDLLRLRNEVRQLRTENLGLTQQVQ